MDEAEEREMRVGKAGEACEEVGPGFSAVVFDLDGTLLDTEALSDEAMLRALEAAGFNVVAASASFPRLLPWSLCLRVCCRVTQSAREEGERREVEGRLKRLLLVFSAFAHRCWAGRALKRNILGRRGSEFGPIVVEYAEREWPGGAMEADTLWCVCVCACVCVCVCVCVSVCLSVCPSV